MTIKPIGTRVLIEPLEEEKENKTKGGIYISEEKNNNLNIGKVIETGKNVRNINKGEKVLYKDFEEAEYEGYIIIKEDNIIAKL
ncbi:co-chaperone GroES [Candidatus Woesearchaeota archaeon]|nr:co-chaperone GroES [Candidatus Woesearchaeota archaeon]